MKKMISFLSIIAMMMVLLSGVLANAQQTGQSAAKPSAAKTAKPEKAKTTTPGKSDSEVQTCIQQKIKDAAKLSALGLSAAVSGGTATLSGTAPNGGSKGAATNIAKHCGAKNVTNNITIKAADKPAAKPTAVKK